MYLTESPLPAWASRRSDGCYTEMGTQLCTRDGQVIGNAVLVCVVSYEAGTETRVTYRVITDIGTMCEFTEKELEQLFWPPKYIMCRASLHERITRNFSLKAAGKGGC